MTHAEDRPGHVVLLGDSIFDNGVYVPGGPDVVTHLRGELPAGWAATLLAVDGDVTAGIPRQLASLPADATHLVVSVGGNDALGHAHLLGAPVRSVAEGIALLGRAQSAFERDYAAMLDGVLATGLPTAVCTVYDTNPSAPEHAVIRSALALFNDAITRTAFARAVPVVDLRLVCTQAADYANPIEPSVVGGARIARAVAAAVLVHRDARRSTVTA
ncbi:SGNH/GDSL hydrolase family protein [Cellulomonas aerilata]|uniref:SGNH hydrolase-type esterase domain-containing protein n=1 Tax=Cellulomonas aerilata TaxID=515326 RepID=A0A512DH11_9CELL|nr:SGNH/GDSL hydrolase family protein [Cellulomonas aerilata]GEO35769.1 hypothetical protein CAE01nite_34940 [Cellulomonas aerilata]